MEARLSTAICVALLFVVFAAMKAEGDVIYRYVDEDGRTHFSNVPYDTRFRPWDENLRDDPEHNFRRLEGLIERISLRHRIDPDLVKAIIKIESNFDPWAVSCKGAMGLMQLMPQTAERWEVHRPFDPTENIKGGIRHFKFLLEKFSGDLRKSLAAYNAGENIVARLGRIPPYKETIRYVKLVMREFKNFQRMRNEQNGIKGARHE